MPELSLIVEMADFFDTSVDALLGYERKDNRLEVTLQRALELLEYFRFLLVQNTDPEVSEITIYGGMAEVYLALGEGEEAVELLKRYNAGGIYNDLIGLSLASNCNRPDNTNLFYRMQFSRMSRL